MSLDPGQKLDDPVRARRGEDLPFGVHRHGEHTLILVPSMQGELLDERLGAQIPDPDGRVVAARDEDVRDEWGDSEGGDGVRVSGKNVGLFAWWS